MANLSPMMFDRRPRASVKTRLVIGLVPVDDSPAPGSGTASLELIAGTSLTRDAIRKSTSSRQFIHGLPTFRTQTREGAYAVHIQCHRCTSNASDSFLHACRQAFAMATVSCSRYNHCLVTSSNRMSSMHLERDETSLTQLCHSCKTWASPVQTLRL